MAFEPQANIAPIRIGEIQFTFTDFGTETEIDEETGEKVVVKPETSAEYDLTIIFDDDSRRRRSGLLRLHLTQQEIAGLLILFERLRQEATEQIIG